jgi:hypothetical protein
VETSLAEGLGKPTSGISLSAAEEGARMHDIDHIRKELTRLSKMARSLRQKELAHFIEVASEVALEKATKAAGAKETRH